MLLLNDPPKTISVVIRYVCATQSVSGGPLPKRLKAMGAFPVYKDRSWMKCLSTTSTVASSQTTPQEHSEEEDDDYLAPEQAARLQFLSDRLTPDRLKSLVENFPTPPRFYSE